MDAEFLTIPEIAKLLRIGQRTAYTLACDGKPPVTDHLIAFTLDVKTGVPAWLHTLTSAATSIVGAVVGDLAVTLDEAAGATIDRAFFASGRGL